MRWQLHTWVQRSGAGMVLWPLSRHSSTQHMCLTSAALLSQTACCSASQEHAHGCTAPRMHALLLSRQLSFWIKAAHGLLHGSGSADTLVTAPILPEFRHTGQGHDSTCRPPTQA